ncbi:MAG: hypothetical protein VW548_06445, partial [Methylotenera sp.]
MTNKGEPAVQPKTAVVLIHGIGEQRPMSTLWGFVDAIWSSDQSLVEPHNSAIYAKPDTINDSFELRRVTTRYWSGDPERRIDFFEFYWAHLMRGNTVHGTIGWMISLFWRRPSTVPKGLLGAWLLGLLFLLLAGALAVLAVVQNVMAVGDYPEWIVYAGAVVSALGSLIASRWFAPIAGDAARYFSPDPDNVEARQKIRLAGIQVIEKLTASKAYDRIIVVGHSLGSAIGLDIISYGFSRVGANQWEVAHPIGSKAANILRELERIAGAISDAEVATIGALRAEYRKAQRRYAAALSEGWDRGAAPWLVTD